MSLQRIPGITSQSIEVFIQDATGAPRTGLVFNSAGLKAYYRRGNAAAVAITLVTLANATAAYSSGGFVEIDATNLPGMYRLDLPNAALVPGVDDIIVILSGASNMTACPNRLRLRANETSVYENLCQSGTATTARLHAGASSVNDIYNRMIATIVAGTGAGQSRYTIDYDGTTKDLTVSPAWVTNPDATSVIVLTPWGIDISDAATFIDQFYDEATAGHNIAGTFGERITRIPNVAAGANGGLPTVDASNRIAGIQGTINTLDGLNTSQNTQHTTTQSRLPAALVSGRMDASVGAMASNVLTAAAIASAAFTAGKFAADAIDANALAASAASEVADAVAAKSLTGVTIPADGTRPTIAQAMLMVTQLLTELNLSGSVLQVRDVDGSTVLFSLTLSPDATNPTSRTRTS